MIGERLKGSTYEGILPLDDRLYGRRRDTMRATLGPLFRLNRRLSSRLFVRVTMNLWDLMEEIQ